ncbi:MAG: hypothetical protein LBU77_05960 [Clostridiales bacterium]|jgi:S-DNA-T family DNA segregation ATPase FtsK/SpoIIIE|nr:hypothetical protein [Clostridiales bacterium]
MDNNRKFLLKRQTKHRYYLLRLELGCKAVMKDRRKTYLLLGYVGLAVVLWLFRVPLFGLGGGDLLGSMKRVGFENLFRVGSVAGFVGLVMLFGMPFGSKAVHENLERIGFTNSAGETPLLVSEFPDPGNPRVIIMEFAANGISLQEFEKNRADIEAALNLTIDKIKEGESKRRVLLYAVPAGHGLPLKLYFDGSCLSYVDFVLVLGESLTGRVTVNLAQIPHILLGGSTGSGKSFLLKFLLIQCLLKGAEVHIADFKGGVDFPGEWHTRCNIITDGQCLLLTLADLAEKLEMRKRWFKSEDCANLGEYNRKTGARFPRIVFACDEVAEILDKTGLDKQGKEFVARIEGYLSTIARQGRAFGIHAILSTQRPDANILAGQIRNNIDYRVCGRADNVLSQIILDSTAASEQIPKDAQGRFITHDGTVFQAYLFDEKAELAKGGIVYD